MPIICISLSVDIHSNIYLSIYLSIYLCLAVRIYFSLLISMYRSIDLCSHLFIILSIKWNIIQPNWFISEILSTASKTWKRGRWFDLQWWRLRYTLLMRPNKVETAVQCPRISCVGVLRIFWSW